MQKHYKSISALLFIHGYYILIFGNWGLVMFSMSFMALYLAVCAIEFALFSICVGSYFLYNKIKGIDSDITKLRIVKFLEK